MVGCIRTVGCTQYQFHRVGADKTLSSLFSLNLFPFAFSRRFYAQPHSKRIDAVVSILIVDSNCVYLSNKNMFSFIYCFAYCLSVSSCAHHVILLSHPNKRSADSTEGPYRAFDSTAQCKSAAFGSTVFFLSNSIFCALLISTIENVNCVLFIRCRSSAYFLNKLIKYLKVKHIALSPEVNSLWTLYRYSIESFAFRMAGNWIPRELL